MIDKVDFMMMGRWWYNSPKKARGLDYEGLDFGDNVRGFTSCVSRVDEGAQNG